MSKVHQLQIGAIVKAGECTTIVRAKLEDAFGLVPTMYLLEEVCGDRCFKVIADVGAYEIERDEADAILAKVSANAWRDAGDVIRRAQRSARQVFASTRCGH